MASVPRHIFAPPIGSHVTVTGVRSRPELNGRTGRILSHDPAKQRCGILVDGETRVLSLAASNLQAEAQTCGPVDAVEGVLEERCMRAAVRSFAPGDRVATATGAEGTIASIAGRLATVLTDGDVTEVSLLRDCSMLIPTGSWLAPKCVKRALVLGQWAARCTVDAAGGWAIQGGGRGRGGLERDGVHWLLQVGMSECVPDGLRALSLELAFEGMDQGWGNTGDSGVQLVVHHGGRPFATEPLVRVVYDRQRQRSRVHRVMVPLGTEIAPRPGDRVEVQLICPNYPGWSAYCEKVCITLMADEVAPNQVSPTPLPATWREHAGCAFEKLWAAMADDDHLAVHPSHMSLSALQQQQVCPTVRVESASDRAHASEIAASLPDRLRSLLARHSGGAAAASNTDAKKARSTSGAIKLLVAIGRDAALAQEPHATVALQGRAYRCALAAHCTLTSLETDEQKMELLQTVVDHWAEAEGNCAYRWERELAMMQDLVTSGRGSSADAEHIEDGILRALVDVRRRLAESELHEAKRHSDDMHFESHFYSTVSFGLPEQEAAQRDPNRLTYAENRLTSFSAAAAEARLHRRYGPAQIRAAVRSELLERKTAHAQLLREKLVDWLSANIPDGVLPHGSSAERREKWLYVYCHDPETYELKEAALTFALCSMHVLQVRKLADGEVACEAFTSVSSRAGVSSAAAGPEGAVRDQDVAQGGRRGRQQGRAAQAHLNVGSRPTWLRVAWLGKLGTLASVPLLLAAVWRLVL